MRKQQLSEKIVSDGISRQGFTIYHRTGGHDVQRAKATIDSILKSGFKPGTGEMYGKGLYGTTDRKSSFAGGNTSSYGIGIIKYLVPIKGVLVFDYNLSGILFGTSLGRSGYPAYSLCDQLVRYGICSPDKIPEIYKVLSVDLECTWGASGRRLSADRAYQIFVECIYKGNTPIVSGVKNCSNVDQEITNMYINAAYTIKSAKALNGKIAGIVYSGNHDGNAIVMYKFTQAKPLMWGISDPGDPGNPKAWAVPMTPVGKSATAADMASMIVDTAADQGKISKRGSVDAIYVEGMDISQLHPIVKALPSLAPWLSNPINGFNGISVAIPSKVGQPSVIYQGTWSNGSFSGYFGGDPVCIQQAEKLIGKPLPTQHYEANWEKGTFEGGYFGGMLNGGVFAKGQFEGVFNGGLWKYNKDAIWGKNAAFTSSSKHFIEFEGKIYDLDCKPDDWVAKKLAARNTKGGIVNYVDNTLSLQENIENSLPYKAKVSVSNLWGPKGSVEDKFKYARQQFDWLWQKATRYAQPPEFLFTDDGVELVSGLLNFGRVGFCKYHKNSEIAGGIIQGDNIFEGSMRAGIYERGRFQGKWYGGVWNDATCKWYDGVATLIPGATIGNTKVIAQTTIIVNKKSHEIIPEAYLAWKTIPELVQAIKDNTYQTLVTKSKQSGKSGVAMANQIAKRFNTNKFTADDLLAIVADDDDSDDSNVFGESEKSFKEILYEGFSARSDIKAEKFFEKEFYYGNLSSDEQDRLYAEFKQSYEKATGAAFDRSAFDWRADNWTFMGDAPDDKNPNAPVGGIAVRKQQSNDMYKLVASFGGFRSVMKGFIELNQKHGNSSIWGIVTPEIKKMLLRANKDFVGLPGAVAKAMEPAIKKFSNGEVKSVGINGVMKVETPSGLMDKVFVCNKNYIRWLISSVEDPAMQSRLPVPQAVIKPLLHLVKALVK